MLRNKLVARERNISKYRWSYLLISSTSHRLRRDVLALIPIFLSFYATGPNMDAVFWLASAVFFPSRGGAKAGLVLQYHSSQPIHLSSRGKIFIPSTIYAFFFPVTRHWFIASVVFCCTLHYRVVLCDVYYIFVNSAMTPCRYLFILKQFHWGRSSSGKEEEKQHILWKLVLFCVMDEPTVGTQDVVKTDKGWSFRFCSTI